MRGYSAIGLSGIKNKLNYGGVIRAAHCYRAAMIAVSGSRVNAKHLILDPSNVSRGERHLPVVIGNNLHDLIPYDCVPVAVEFIDGSIELQNYQHPVRAFYVFGPEDGTLDASVLSWCRDVVVVPTRICMNLAATVNVVLYDRLAKQLLDAKRQARSENLRRMDSR